MKHFHWHAVGLAFSLSSLLPGLATALPLGYETLQITVAPDMFTHSVQATINDSGEIVYLQQLQNQGFEIISTRLVSTRRGELTPELDPNLRSPNMNNLGQVVYTNAAPPPLRGPLTVFSTDGSEIGSGNSAKINDLGFVAAEGVGPLGIYQLGIYAPDLTLTPIALDQDASFIRKVINLTNDGEIIYIATAVSGIEQLFSTTRGQLTHLEAAGLHWATANDNGEFSYNFAGSLYWQDGTRISDGVISCEDMNNLGDIVCNHAVFFPTVVGTHVQNVGAGETILFTQHAAEYQQRDGFKLAVPEPAGLILLLIGVATLALTPRRTAVSG